MSLQFTRVFSMLAAAGLAAGLLAGQGPASAATSDPQPAITAAAVSSGHHGHGHHPAPRLHATRVVRPAHTSLRVVRLRHVRVVHVHGSTRPARVVPWHRLSHSAAPDAHPAATSPIQTTAAVSGVPGGGDSGIIEFPVPTSSSAPEGVTTTADGNAWFAESSGDKIGEVTAGGSFTEYPVPAEQYISSGLRGIAAGPDGNLWFTTYSYIGEMTPSGTFSFFPITRYSGAYDITQGPDGNMWFTEGGGNVGYVTPGGAVTEYSLDSGPGSGIDPQYITAGPDGKLWVTAPASGANYVYSITTGGSVTQYVLPSGWSPSGIARGADGQVWFGSSITTLTAMTTSGAYTSYTWPEITPNGYNPNYVREDGRVLVFANQDGGAIGEMSTAGEVAFTSQPASDSESTGIAVAPDGAIWYSGTRANVMGLLPAGPGQFPPVVPTARTYGCACGTPVAARPEAYRGDPVNTATGAYSDTVTDASLPGPGVAFAFTRAYTSADPASGPLGPGWTDPYQASLSFDSSGDATFTSGDGQQVQYTYSGGTYHGGPGVSATLAAVSGGYQLTALDGTRYAFNGSGQLTAITDRTGTGVSLAYSGGQLASVSDAGGRTVTFGYNGSGLLTSLTLPGGSQVGYGYTGGLLTSVTAPGGGVTQYAYNGAGELTTITDPDGHVVLTNAYDPATGRITSQTNGDGNTTTFSWDATTQTATTTDPDGGTWTDVYYGNVLISQTGPSSETTSYSYDDNLDLTAVTDPAGNTTTMTYDAAGNMLTKTAPAPLDYTQSWTWNSMNEVLTATDGRGKTTTYAYDPSGLLTSVTDPAGHATSYTYYSDGQVKTVTDPDGHVTTDTYDSHDDLATVTDPAGRVTSYAYNADGQVTGVTDPAGKTTTTAYNTAREVASVTDPLGHATTYTYDADGNVATVTTPEGDTTSYGYDHDGNETSVTDPRGKTTSFTYGADGKIASETDPENNTTSYVYDDYGDLTQVTLPNNLTETYQYNTVNQLTTYTDASGNTTRYVTDPLGRVTSVTDPNRNTTSYTWDGDGNQTSATNPAGQVTTYAYDDDSRLTGVTYSDGTTPAVTYSYDHAGLRTAMTDGTGTTTYAYNDDGQPTSVTDGNGHTVAYTYNADGNPATITYPNGKTVTEGYNDAQQVTAVTDWNNNTTAFTYNKDGIITGEAYPNGDTAAYTVNADDQITAITDTNTGGTTLAGFTYTRGDNSEITAATTTGTAITAPSQTYTYNNLSQLTGAGTSTYGYDHAGDPTTLGSTSQGFDSGGQLFNSYNTANTVYAFNSSGDRTSATSAGATTSYAYDQANQLTTYTPATGPATSYAYTGDGLLSAQTTSSTATTYTWNTTTQVPEMLTAGATSYIYGPDGLPIESVDSSGTATYYLHDQLGSTRLLTDPTGAVTGTYTYDPWGNTASHTGAAATPLQYAGQYHDPATSFYYLRNRYYDPATAQFLTIDPAVNQTQAPYTYTADNPLNATDPTGLCSPLILCLFTGLVTQGAREAGHLWMTEQQAYLQWLEQARANFQESFCSPWNQLALGMLGEGDFAGGDFAGGDFAAEETGALADASNAAFEAADNADSWTVSAKHLAGAAGRWAKFADGTDPNALVQEALRSPDAMFLPNPGGQAGSFIVRTDLGSVIGTNGQTALRVVVSSDGRIITAFPVK